MLPIWLRRLSNLIDPRDATKLKHKMSAILLFGLLCFVFQMTSRRQANAQMSMPTFLKNLQALFPELETMPHADTLNRFLENMDVESLQTAHIDLIKDFIRKKKFDNYLIQKCYPVAVDGTQKLIRNGQWWPEEWLQRSGTAEGEEWKKSYVYVLEANIVLCGITLPLYSEFLSYLEGDTDEQKQDCELKAFKRLAAKLKKFFPRLPILMLLDGLYPSGPIFEICIANHWDFMIVLKDKSLATVWKQFDARENPEKLIFQRIWKGREQTFQWANNLIYKYDGDDGQKKVVTIHLVVCDEQWKIVNDDGDLETKTSRHSWVCAQPTTVQNVHERCNLGARARWGIEDSNHTEKHRGYCYEHAFSHNWNAMRGFHYLMRLAHLINALSLATRAAKKWTSKMGIREFLSFVKETIKNPWLTKEWIAQFLKTPFELQI